MSRGKRKVESLTAEAKTPARRPARASRGRAAKVETFEPAESSAPVAAPVPKTSAARRDEAGGGSRPRDGHDDARPRAAHASDERRARMLASPGWQTALAQFARATGLAVTLYDASGGLRAGPFTTTPLGACLAASGGWEAGGRCRETEAEVSAEAVREGATVRRTALDALSVFAVPLGLEGQRFGAVVAGWVFDNFADPVATDLLARKLGLSFHELWHVVRQQPPVSHEKLTTYAELLHTLCDSLLRERAEVLREQEQSRELLVLNESGRRLTEAATAEEIGAAVVEAAARLAGTNRVRMLVAREGGAGWRTVASLGFEDDGDDARAARPARGRPRRITGSLRFPVEAADGALLGLIEVSEPGGYPTAQTETQMQALAAQAVVALQKAQVVAALERQRASLEHANKVKDEFLSVLSHELRTPLTPILGWVSMLRQKSGDMDGEMTRTALSAIERNARQELHLVEELLDLSRILNDKVQLEPELVEPTNALAAAFASAQTLAATRRLHLNLDASQHLPHVYVDPRRLQQVLSNILSNAVKFTPDGGTITLGVRLGEAGLPSSDGGGQFEAEGGERDSLRVSSSAGGAVEFFVNDTGVGIRPEVVRHIFDRFHQGDASTTRRYGGLGIGLSVVRGLVELQGGRVWAESDGDGRGATFVVRFPAAGSHDAQRATGEQPATAEQGVPDAARAREHAAAEPAPDRSAASAPAAHVFDESGPRTERRPARESRRARVLVVDDSTDTLGVVRAMLEDAGYEVEIADSADGGLDAARRFAPDCVLTDLGMPERDGFSLIETLRAEPALAAAPVIALTGFVTHPDREATQQAGFAAHLPKPVEQHALVAAINAALATVQRTE